MNGVASASMRAYGLNYKLNFGVSIPKIKEIALRYKPDKELAECLWKEETRELKILATLLYPVEDFDEDTAKRWIKEIPNQEIREQLGFNLIKSLSYTYNLGLECINSNDQEIRASGYWFLGRHLMTNSFEDVIELNCLENVWTDVVSEYIILRNAAKILLKSLGKVSEIQSKEILKRLSALKNSKNALEAEVYYNLVFEYDFHYGRI